MKILFIHFGNFMRVQGSTEPHYVYRFLQSKHQVTAIGIREILEYGRREGEGELHTISQGRPIWSRVLPKWLYLDLKAFNLVKDLQPGAFDLVWSYKGILLTPLWLQRKYNTSWIMDLRTPPVEQNKEFLEYRGESSLRRSLYNRTMKGVYKKALNRADKVLSVSGPFKEFLESEYNIEPEKIYVQSLGVDMSKFKPSQNHSLGGDKLKIACVTSIAPHRKLELLIKILKRLKDREVEAEMAVIGSGFPKYQEDLKDFASKGGVSEQLHWKGYVDHEDIPAILGSCDIGLSPLPNFFSYRVSSPAKVFEYLAMELVVIASDIKAHRKILTDGETGLLVPPEKVSCWADAIERVAGDRALRRKLKSNARDHVRKYDWGYMMEKLDNSILSYLKGITAS